MIEYDPQQEGLFVAEKKTSLDDLLQAAILGHLSKLKQYVYKGTKKKEQIRVSFRNDPVYSIFGLDSPEYINATLAGGVITSVHRKIGDAYEASVKLIVTAQLGVAPKHITYTAKIASGAETRDRMVDALIEIEHVAAKHRSRIRDLAETEIRKISSKPSLKLKGLGFEVRHCYQSADSKRAQADEAMGQHLAVSGFVPVMLVFCSQSNQDILRRYQATWIVREGMDAYDFLKSCTGYDFYGFLVKHKEKFQEHVHEALRKLSGGTTGA